MPLVFFFFYLYFIEIFKKKRTSERRPLWFIFSGMGSQWSGMGRDLMQLKLFRESIERSAEILKPYKVDLFQLIWSSKPSDLEKPMHSFVTLVAIQVALLDCLKAMNIEPDGIVGHSVGELGKEMRNQIEFYEFRTHWLRLCICGWLFYS